MKNSIILDLVGTGFLLTTTNTMSPASAYKILKARKEISKASEAIEERRKDLLKECNLDTDEAQEQLKKLDANELSAEEKVDVQDRVERFRKMYNECLDEDVKLDVKAVPYEQWHAFLKENAKITPQGNTEVPFRLGNLEWELENVLWETPEE